MKILVVGDFHGKFPTKLKNVAKDVDFIFSTGDFGGSDRLLKIIFKYLKQKWWKKVGIKKAKEYVLEDYNSGKKIINELDSLDKPVYTIFGNWDFNARSHLERTAGIKLVNYQNLIRKTKNIKYWRRGVRKFNGLSILSFDKMVTAGAYLDKGSFDEKRRKRYIKQNKKERNQIFSYGKKGIDILFAHYTPYGYFDIVKYKGVNPMNGKHVGFKGYTEFIKKFQPRIFLCGHMHEYQGVRNLGKTKIIATGAAKDGKAVIIEIPENKKKKIKVKFIK